MDTGDRDMPYTTVAPYYGWMIWDYVPCTGYAEVAYDNQIGVFCGLWDFKYDVLAQRTDYSAETTWVQLQGAIVCDSTTGCNGYDRHEFELA